MNQTPGSENKLVEAEQFLNARDYEAAENLYRDLSMQHSGNGELHFQLGMTLHIQGKFDLALQSYEQALQINPGFPEAHNNVGLIRQSQGRLVEAANHFKKALDQLPEFVDALINLANVLHQQGEYEEAESFARKALATAAYNPRALNTLGVILKSVGKLPEAISTLKKAIALDPQYIEAHNNLGNAYKQADDLEQASKCYENALAIDPENIETLINLGNTAQALGRPDIALQCFELALDQSPDFPEAHWNRAVTLLLMGDYSRGWSEYEWGFKAGQRSIRQQELPEWDGSIDNHKTIYVYWEQGLGDTLQFIRYLPLIRNLGLHVILECQPELVSLIEGSKLADQVVVEGEDTDSIPQCDAAISLMSLPHIFGTLMDTVPSGSPYIRPDPEKVDLWRQRLEQDNNFKIGIVWAGSAHHQNDRNRSCSLDQFKDLDREGITLYSLQKGVEPGVLTRFGHGMIDLSCDLNDFSDTAAAIQNLDLIITVDTSVAHLAGAMNKPVWVLLPYAADWRWLVDRDDSPWYPSAKLFRQTCPGDWETTFNNVVNTLAETVFNNSK